MVQEPHYQVLPVVTQAPVMGHQPQSRTVLAQEMDRDGIITTFTTLGSPSNAPGLPLRAIIRQSGTVHLPRREYVPRMFPPLPALPRFYTPAGAPTPYDMGPALEEGDDEVVQRIIRSGPAPSYEEVMRSNSVPATGPEQCM